MKMNRSPLEQTLRQVNGRNQVRVDLSKVEKSIELIESDIEFLKLSNLALSSRLAITNTRIGDITTDLATLSNETLYNKLRTVNICSSGSSREQTVDTDESGVDESRMV